MSEQVPKSSPVVLREQVKYLWKERGDYAGFENSNLLGKGFESMICLTRPCYPQLAAEVVCSQN